MYRCEHRHQLSFEDFFLAFGGKLSGDNLWIMLAELIPWDALEDEDAAQFCKSFGKPEKLYRIALGAMIIKPVSGSRMKNQSSNQGKPMPPVLHCPWSISAFGAV